MSVVTVRGLSKRSAGDLFDNPQTSNGEHPVKVTWFTNDPQAAERLRRADKTYDTARTMAAGLPLAEKIIALRNAKIARDEAYAAATET